MKSNKFLSRCVIIKTTTNPGGHRGLVLFSKYQIYLWYVIYC